MTIYHDSQQIGDTYRHSNQEVVVYSVFHDSQAIGGSFRFSNQLIVDDLVTTSLQEIDCEIFLTDLVTSKVYSSSSLNETLSLEDSLNYKKIILGIIKARYLG